MRMRVNQTHERALKNSKVIVQLDLCQLIRSTAATSNIWCEVLSKEANERYVKDNHSPGKYRANIPLINSPEFSSVFNCPVGTPMNPVKKCRLWG
ncbi:peptidase_M13 domain-containing protein [Nephila pilipes]|uniref:Peptidase_M13 domain-containing protein n=1 Tax=Nephila pilipes TaxID=299642 RepID=A0A8X6U1X4_NEPPI|nr:peptidase_M13 domain-containing protein [Nephila pilipes]